MTTLELARLVRQMRAQQTTYFRSEAGTTAKRSALDESRRLERLVDEAVTGILSGRAQATLFGGDDRAR